jgi:acetyltransferase
MERTRIYTALKGVRGRKPVDLLRSNGSCPLINWSLNRLDCGNDINHSLFPRALLALDARIVLHSPDQSEDNLPTLAIRPYPAHVTLEMKDGAGHDKAIRPERAPLVKFHQTPRGVSITVLHAAWNSASPMNG